MFRVRVHSPCGRGAASVVVVEGTRHLAILGFGGVLGDILDIEKAELEGANNVLVRATSVRAPGCGNGYIRVRCGRDSRHMFL